MMCFFGKAMCIAPLLSEQLLIFPNVLRCGEKNFPGNPYFVHFPVDTPKRTW